MGKRIRAAPAADAAADPAEQRLHAAFIRVLRAADAGLGRQRPAAPAFTAAVAQAAQSVAGQQRERAELLRQFRAASARPGPAGAADPEEWLTLLPELLANRSELKALARTDGGLIAELEAALAALASPLYPLPLAEFLPLTDSVASVEEWAAAFAVFDGKHAELLADPHLTEGEREERLRDWSHRQRQFVSSIIEAMEEEAEETEEEAEET